VRVVIADDSLLIRDGLASLLRDAGVDVVAQTAGADDLLLKIASYEPDVAIIDIRMPPTHTDEGLRAAEEIRRRYPEVGIVILSQYVEVGIATRLLAESPAGVGYLLKDRVTNLEDFTAALQRIAAGGSALDPDVVSSATPPRAGARPRSNGTAYAAEDEARSAEDAVESYVGAFLDFWATPDYLSPSSDRSKKATMRRSYSSGCASVPPMCPEPRTSQIAFGSRAEA
jgi:DNA-binding NarL/FixJ family response regulator